MADEYLDLSAAAALLSVNPDTLRRKLKSGAITGRKVDGQHGPRWEVLVRDGSTVAPTADTTPDPAMHTVSTTPDQPSAQTGSTLAPDAVAELVRLVDRLQRENLEMAGRIGYYQAKLQHAEERIALLEAPKASTPPAAEADDDADVQPAANTAPRRSWWRWLFGDNY